MDQAVVDLLYEAKLLKEVPRSGYQYLGAGRESVAEHSFMVTFIAHVVSRIEPAVDALKLLRMCLIHDLPEARIGDLNSVQKKYVTADEGEAISDMTKRLPFGVEIRSLLEEFRAQSSLEARLAHDADQLALLIDLKSLQDVGYTSPGQWIEHVAPRMKTEIGERLARGILETDWNHWWLQDL
jgi:5'-deoxynucleotidase YfbR-like HD superfamily hydrolase